MNGSVLGALRLDDSDSLRSEILRAEAEFTVSVSAVEGIPSPSLTRIKVQLGNLARSSSNSVRERKNT